MAAQKQRMGYLDAEQKRAVEMHALKLSEVERAQQAERIRQGLMRGIQLYENGDLQGLNMVLMGAGEEPIRDISEFPAIAGKYKEVFETLRAVREFNAPPAPLSVQGKTQADINAGILAPDTPLSAPDTVIKMPDGSAGIPADEARLREKLADAESDEWKEYLKSGANSAGIRHDMQLLNELMTMAPQGPVTGRIARMFPGVNSAADAFNSVVMRVAPTLRAPGSGSTSDIEYDGFLKSLPALANKPEANAAIAGMVSAKAQINIERAEVVRDYQNEEISVKEARRRLSEIDNRSIMTPELTALIDALDASAVPANDGATGYEDVPTDQLIKELGLE